MIELLDGGKERVEINEQDCPAQPRAMQYVDLSWSHVIIVPGQSDIAVRDK